MEGSMIGSLGTAEKGVLGVMKSIWSGRLTGVFFQQQENYEDRISYSMPDGEKADKTVLCLEQENLGLRDCGRVDIREDRDGEPSL